MYVTEIETMTPPSLHQGPSSAAGADDEQHILKGHFFEKVRSFILHIYRRHGVNSLFIEQ